MPSIRSGTALWLDASVPNRTPAWPRLRGNHATDVVIIGGGLAGCTAAFVFAQAGLRPWLLERDRIGRGATAGTPGLIDAGAGARFHALKERHGLRAARDMWDASRHAALDLQALARRLKIRCGLDRVDVMDVAASPEAAVSLEREYEALNAAGFGSVWLTGTRARTATGLQATAALRRADAGLANPIQLAVGLLRQAESRGAVAYEHSEVAKLTIGRKAVELRTSTGTVRAASVIVATDLPQPNLRALHRHLRQVAVAAVALGQLPAPVRGALGSTTAVVREYAERSHAWRRDAKGRVLAWESNQAPIPPRRHELEAIQRTNELMYEMSVLFPDLSGQKPESSSATSSYRSIDGLVVAGPHRAFPRLLFAVGLGVDGLQGALLAARLNLRHHLGASEKGDELFGFIR